MAGEAADWRTYNEYITDFAIWHRRGSDHQYCYPTLILRGTITFEHPVKQLGLICLDQPKLSRPIYTPNI